MVLNNMTTCDFLFSSSVGGPAGQHTARLDDEDEDYEDESR